MLFTELQDKVTFGFILTSKTNPPKSATSKRYLELFAHPQSSTLQPQATQKHFLLPELNEPIKGNKCCQTVFWVIGEREDKTGFAKWTSHSLWISTHYGWLSTQELFSISPENKYTCLMNVNVFAFAIHYDSQWLMCGARGHDEKSQKM